MLNIARVLVAILNYNGKRSTLRCLSSIEQLNYNNFDILVIDNGSDEDVISEIINKYPNVFLKEIKENIGAAGGRNVAIDFALSSDYKYIFFLDNDALVDRNTLNKLVEFAEANEDIAAVGAKTYYYKSNKIWNFGGNTDWLRGEFFGTCQGVLDIGQFNLIKEVDTFPIGFGLVRMRIIKEIGKISEDYFIYYEESDWHIKMKKLGYKIFVIPDAYIWHEYSSSLGRETPSFYYYRTRNRLLFMRRNSSRFNYYCFLMYFFYDFMKNTIYTLYFSRKNQQLRAAIIGVIDFTNDSFGKRRISNSLLEDSLLVSFSKIILKLIEAKIVAFTRKLKVFCKKIFKKNLNIKVISTWNLGDEVMAIPVYEALKEKYPSCIINVRTNYHDLLVGNPFVDHINNEFFRPDIIYRITGEDKTFNRLKYLSKIMDLEIKNRHPSVFLSKKEIESIKISSNSPKIVLSTGASWKTKKWGIDNFRGVAKFFMEKYNAKIIEIGRNCESTGLGESFINKTSIRQAAIIIKQCDLFIGNDSGISHLALAVDVPVIALFGPVNHENLYPIMNEKLYPLKANVSCQGCWSKGQMINPDCCPQAITNCMDNIKVNNVIEIAESIIRKSGY